MFNLISHNFPNSLLGQTALMFIVLALVLAVLWAFISHHYFMGAVTVCYGFVIGWFAGWLAKGKSANKRGDRRQFGLMSASLTIFSHTPS
jgi:hypothetical protein